MIPRQITTSLKRSLTQFPIVSLTGPRQSGKTTLLRNEFPDYSYVLLEDPDVRAFVRMILVRFCHFMRTTLYSMRFSVYQNSFPTFRDKSMKQAQWGSISCLVRRIFFLMDAISQSLAGRVAIRHLPPLSYCEVKAAGRQPESVEAWVVRGGLSSSL